MKIYFDMDGVLCNFLGRVVELTGAPFVSGEWDELNQHSHLYSDLAPIKPMVRLVHRLYELEYHLEVLSATPAIGKIEYARQDKFLWCAWRLPPIVVNIVDHAIKKQTFAAPDAILIDDSLRNCTQWREAGGIAIYHTSYKETVAELERILGVTL
jgi:hypothetical protein